MSNRKGPTPSPAPARRPANLPGFRSGLLGRIRAEGNVWRLRGGQILLPEVFGFCRGVERALTMMQEAVASHRRHGGRLFLLGQIIHNPWVNEYFQQQGVRLLGREEMQSLERHIAPADCAVIPAFGVPLPLERRLRAIGCSIVDTSCGDVRRLWSWTERAARAGCGVLIFGRADHDETVVTKSRLADAGGKFLVVGNLEQTRLFCELLTARGGQVDLGRLFGPQATNADGLDPFARLAQVSQTTMLYDDTLAVRKLLKAAYAERFGIEASQRLEFQPTVCRATQARQTAAVELCRRGCDLVVVVGGFGSSNTRHLYELARQYAPAWFIETASAIHSAEELEALDPQTNAPALIGGWLPARRPLRIGVLAGASSPEIAVGEVLQRLAELLDG